MDRLSSRSSNRRLIPFTGAFAAIFIAAWFLARTWPGLFVYFHDDDLMNIWFGWEHPLWKLLLANLVPFTSLYRPLGSLLYVSEYHAFGPHPLPYRIVSYMLMLIDIGLVAGLARRLSQSGEVAFLAALAFAFHNRLDALYWNNGTIFDVLCFTFYVLTLLVYVGIRGQGRSPRGVEYLALYLLATAALNSKEMAITLPVMIAAYEVFFHGRKLARLPIALFTALAVGCAVARMSGGRLTNNPAYKLDVSMAQFLSTTHDFMAHLFYLPFGSTSAVFTAAILAAAFLIGIASRRPYLQFAAVFIVVTPLPVNFIPNRDLFAIYIPFAGWCMLFGGVVVELRNLAVRRYATSPAAIGATVLAGTALLGCFHHGDRRIPFEDYMPGRSKLHQLERELTRLHSRMGRGASVLFLSDPFPVENWMPLFVVRLAYHDPDIVVHRVKMMPTSPNPKDYNYVFDYRDDHVIDVTPRR